MRFCESGCFVNLLTDGGLLVRLCACVCVCEYMLSEFIVGQIGLRILRFMGFH